MQSAFPGTLRSATNLARCLLTTLLSSSHHGIFTVILVVSTNDKEDNIDCITIKSRDQNVAFLLLLAQSQKVSECMIWSKSNFILRKTFVPKMICMHQS